ncbi:MAG: hypothetical protein ACXAEN_25550, partial [Candidatus Thorarchaeota archaeon]
MAKVPIQFNLINDEWQSTANEDIEGAVLAIDDGWYSNTVTAYFEVIAKVGSSESVDCELHNPGDTVKASVTVTATSYTRYRSTSFSLDSGNTEYNLATNNISGETIDIRAARIILIQENTAGALTETMVPIEIGWYGSVFSTPSPYDLIVPDRTKWHLYDPIDWDPDPHTDSNCAIYVEVVYKVADSMYDCNIKLLEYNEFYVDPTPSEITTIVSGGSSETPVVVRSSDISASINADRIYCIGVETEGEKASRSATIFSARLLYYLYTPSGEIDKLETRVLFCNQTQSGGASGNRDYDQYWDPAEIDDFSFKTVHVVIGDTAQDLGKAVIEDMSGPTALDGSETYVKASGGGWDSLPWAWTLRDVTNYPPADVDFSATYSRYAQGVEGSGGRLWKVWARLRKQGSPTGNMYAKIYASTGTMGTNATPTGSVLATSQAVDVSGISTDSGNYDWGEWRQFIFVADQQITLTNGVDYFISFEYEDADASNYIEITRATAGISASFNSAYYDTGWTAETDDHCVEKWEHIALPATAKTLDCDMVSVAAEWLEASYIKFSFTYAPTLEVSEYESVTTSEDVTVSVEEVVTDLSINEFESVTVAENVTVSLPDALEISVFEAAITVTDVVTDIVRFTLPVEIDVFDDVAVTDVETVSLPDALSVSEFEAVTVTEDVTAALPDPLEINEFESVTVVENVTVELPLPLSVSVFEGVGVAEQVVTELPLPLEISVFDS